MPRLVLTGGGSGAEDKHFEVLASGIHFLCGQTPVFLPAPLKNLGAGEGRSAHDPLGV